MKFMTSCGSRHEIATNNDFEPHLKFYRNDDADGHVIVDAVQWIRVGT